MSVDTSTMVTLYFILVLLAVVAFVAAAFLARPQNTTPAPSPLLFVALGLALWAFVPLLQFGQRL